MRKQRHLLLFDNHFIFFNGIDDLPVWCSEPTSGRTVSPRNLAHLLAKRVKLLKPIDSRKALFDMLTNVNAVGLGEQAPIFAGKHRRDILELTHDSLSIIRVHRD